MTADVYAGGVIRFVRAETLGEILKEVERIDKAESRWGGVRKIILVEREKAATKVPS